MAFCSLLTNVSYLPNVLIQAHALIDVHAAATKNTSHQIHTKCLIKHQKIVQKTLKFERYPGLLAAAYAQTTTSL